MPTSAQYITMNVVNVASVPQRSPFRYPGGKTWLVPYIRRWLRTFTKPPSELIEPFAGGAIVGLTAAFEGLAKRVLLIELDPHVAAVWQVILRGDVEWLTEQFSQFEITAESVRAVLTHPNPSLEELAFATIVRNRVQRGGILAAGAGLMKLGENGRGLASRWYPETLRRRILEIAGIRHRIRFLRGDGVRFIEKNKHRRDAVFFIDPPYTITGRRLYRFSDVDHEKLFRLVTTVSGDFLMTYDNTAEIRSLAKRFSLRAVPVPMKNTHHARLTELLIGKDLEWLKAEQTVQLAFPGSVPQRSPGSRDFRR